MPTGVMLFSVCVNNPDINILFHIVVDESVTEENKRDILQTTSNFIAKNIVFYLVDSQLTRQFPLHKGTRITQATYYRLFLTDILPSTIDKVLYLDGDIIVRKTLLPLWKIDLTDYAIGGAFDWAEGRKEIYTRLGYPSTKGHFNAGVLLINLSYWRIHNLKKAFVEYVWNYSDRIKYEDQDVLNVVLQDQKLLIPIKYNFQTGFLKKIPEWNYLKYEEEVNEGLSDPVIVHYTERYKPWYADTFPYHPYRNCFLKYQRKTMWKGVCRDLRPLNIKIRNFIGGILRKLRILKPIKSPFIDVIPID